MPCMSRMYLVLLVLAVLMLLQPCFYYSGVNAIGITAIIGVNMVLYI